jgi:RNA polymerase sigma-70 factor, ECF subfamily
VADADVGEALDAARRGDESGVVVLWRALNPPLLRYARVMVGDAAEDVASETWLSAAREIRGFRGDADGFRVWLFRIARHRALDELRRSGRRSEDLVGLWTEERPAREDTADQAVERLDTARALRLIARLPRDQAEAVLLRAVVGLDVAQCADVLGKRSGAVRVAAVRGLRRLAVLLSEEPPGGTPDGAGGGSRPRTTDEVAR